MTGNMIHFDNFSVVNGDVKIDVCFKRFENQFQQAQEWLDGQIWTDMVPFMPINTGMLRSLTAGANSGIQGTGRVYAAFSVCGRFLYMGKVMIGEESRSPWAYPGEKKIVTNRNLIYSNPSAQPEWFNPAKAAHGKQWTDGVKKRAGGGMRG